MGSYHLQRSSDKQFFFNLLADNHERILTSERYTSKSAALNGISSVKANAAENANYEKATSKNGQFYFNLLAKNHQIIGTSEMYTTERARDNGIASVIANGPKANIDEDED